MTVVLLSYLSLLTVRISLAKAGLLLGLGLVYVALGFLVVPLAKKRTPPGCSLLYFLAMLAIGTGVFHLSDKACMMVLFPLPSFGMILLPRYQAYLAAAMVVLAEMFVFYLHDGWLMAAASSIGVAAAVVFVLFFTRIAVNEERGRAEGERLAAELATLEERNRLAREIHDTLGHYLTAINVQIAAARAMADTDPSRIREAMDKAQRLSRQSLAEVRRAVTALRNRPYAGQPLPEAIARLVEESRAAGIETALTVTGEPRRAEAQVELALYRAAQEGLTNARKHAGAKRIELILTYDQESRVHLTVRDDGQGADVLKEGHGLAGLSERARQLGGAFSTASEPGRGFILTIEVPG